MEKRVAVITGGSRDIGAAIAGKLAMSGVRVLVCCHEREEEAAKVCEEINGKGGEADLFKGDIRNEEELKRLVEQVTGRWGRVDILVHNAKGRIIRKMHEAVEWQDFDAQLDVMLKGFFLMVKKVVPVMKKAGYGRIISVLSSITADTVKGYGVYAAALASVSAYSHILADELGEFGITVNTVSPGFTLTSNTPYAPVNVQNRLREKTPDKKLATPEDIANTIYFLSSEMAGHINGQNIIIDGGRIKT